MPKNPNRNLFQKQKSGQAGMTGMSEEFGAETDVAEVKRQNQQAEAKKASASGSPASRNQNGTK